MNPSINPSERPAADEYFEYYNTYISLVPDGQCMTLLDSQIDFLRQYFSNVSDEAASVTHPPYTWTIKQVVGHLIDTERIFAERLHHFAFGDLKPLPGMDQNVYVENCDFQDTKLADLVDEMILCRRANILMIKRISANAWSNRGVASDHLVSARALLWMLVGHVIHHMTIVQKRLS